MNNKSRLLHWAALLYVFVVTASLPITGPAGGPPPAGLSPEAATIAAQIVLILIPALIFVWLTRQPLRETLKLQPLPFGASVRSLVLGLACWPVFVFLSTVTQALVASIQAPAGAAPTSVTTPSVSPWILLLSIAVIAPICEEVLFRGVLLSAYEPRFAVHAIWLVAILFAFLHPSENQVLGALFVGIAAGWVVYRTRSIWSGILLHAGTNLVSGLLVLLTSLAAPGAVEGAAAAGDAGSMIWIGVAVWGGISLIMLVPIFFLARGFARKFPAPTWPDASLSLSGLWSFGIAVILAVAYTLYRMFPGAA